jgi:hypothetical protein
MTREIFRPLAEGAIDALLLYIAVITAPFSAAKAFVLRAPRVPLEPTRNGERAGRF